MDAKYSLASSHFSSSSWCVPAVNESFHNSCVVYSFCHSQGLSVHQFICHPEIGSVHGWQSWCSECRRMFSVACRSIYKREIILYANSSCTRTLSVQETRAWYNGHFCTPLAPLGARYRAIAVGARSSCWMKLTYVQPIPCAAYGANSLELFLSWSMK